MAQNVRQALLAAKGQGACKCGNTTPCYPIAVAVVLTCGLVPPASVCNNCRGLCNPPPADIPPVPFAPL